MKASDSPQRAETEKEASIARSARLFRPLWILCILAFPLTGMLGCAGPAWESASQEDSAAGYHRFLREHPESEFAAAAEERIDFLKLQREPTLAAFRDFREKHPSSEMVNSLRAQLERATFDEARALGTPAAYEKVASEFPNGEYEARARGNAIYLRDIAPRGASVQGPQLQDFAAEHAESDFAVEAQRSADSVAARLGVPNFQSVGLVLELAASTPEVRRVTEAFRAHAKESYAHAPAKLVFLATLDQFESSGADALITVSHAEEAVETSFSNGVIAKPGVQVRTEVVLSVRGEVLWSRPFEMRVESREHVSRTSVLFSSAGPRYWADFFLPVATWSSRAAVRAPVALEGRVMAVDTQGDRAVVLFEKGDFEILQIANPEAPVRIGAYQRRSRLEKFDGIRVVGDRIAIFGEDGLEVVGLDRGALAPIATWTRGQVGAVSAVEPVADHLLLASNKGLLLAPVDLSASPKRLLRQSIRTMARSGDTVLLADRDMLLLSTTQLLADKKVLGQMRVGRDFAAHRLRVFGAIAFVAGKGGVIVLDIEDPRAPRMLARLLPNRVGAVEDIACVGSEYFLVGERGVQLLGARLDRVVETMDTLPARRAATLGRHLVAVGGEQLQVVDALPFAASSTPKSGAGVAKVRPAAAPSR